MSLSVFYAEESFSSMMHTPYLSAAGQCVELFYRASGSCRLVVRVSPGAGPGAGPGVGPGAGPTGGGGCRLAGHGDGWRRFRGRLPAGVQRVEIVADVSSGGELGSVAVDDLRVYPCAAEEEEEEDGEAMVSACA